jgi:Ca2+-transporting ATPase
VNIFVIAVTVVVVAVPEGTFPNSWAFPFETKTYTMFSFPGLPLAVTLALAFATKRMAREKLLVRVLGSCETMANASVVCTDKTGTLTQNVMKVVAGSIGIHAKFVYNLAQNQARSNADERRTSITSHRSQPSSPTGVADQAFSVPRRIPSGRRKHPKDFSLDQTQLNEALSLQLRNLFNEAICVNSTAFEDTNPDTGKLQFVGSKTETALLTLAKELGWPDYKVTRDAAGIVQMIPFSSARKAMGVVVRLPSGLYRLYLKGASEILSKKCVRHVVVHQGDLDGQNEDVETAPIDNMEKDNISRTIIFYANQTLRTIALCYREFTLWPPTGCQYNTEDEVCNVREAI